MAFGIGITALDAETERAQDTLSSLQFIGELFQFQQRLHPGKEFLGKNRFVQKIVGAGLNSAHTVFTLTQTSDEDKRNEASGRIFLELTAKLVPGFARHDDIGKYQVGRPPEHLYLSLRSIGDSYHVIAAGRKQVLHESHGTGIVVHHQNARKAATEGEITRC